MNQRLYYAVQCAGPSRYCPSQEPHQIDLRVGRVRPNPNSVAGQISTVSARFPVFFRTRSWSLIPLDIQNVRMKLLFTSILIFTCGLSTGFGASDADCAKVQDGLGKLVSTVVCFASPNLTTANPSTTPPDNSLPGLPPGAFTPRTDAVNAPATTPQGRYGTSKTVPGLQLGGAMNGSEGARWLIRLPDEWNGRLIVAVVAGTRSEHASDILMSDYAVQNGYAYAATNKGHFARRPAAADDPMACAASPPGGPGATTYFRQYQSDLEPKEAFAAWSDRTIQIARVAKSATVARFGRQPAFTYLTGLSAGALVTRRVLEVNPEEFDGGLDWAAPYAASLGNPRRNPVPLFNNLVGVFAAAMKAFPEYVASGYLQQGASLELLVTLGMPPDMFGAPSANTARGSYLETHYNAVWMGLQCGNIRASDPEYSGDVAGYRYWERGSSARRSLESIATTGDLQRPLLSVHGTMDATAPIVSSRMYRADVAAQGRAPLHRLYEIQNGTHRDAYKDPPLSFTAVEYILPHYIEAFESLTKWVETGMAPFPSQCIPRGGRLTSNPVTTRCAVLLAP
jgi:hypothetical protein